MIVKAAGRPVTEIFQREGEAVFRSLEKNALKTAATSERCVVSTGGGVPVDPANRALMHEAGMIVRLVATPETIRKRLTEGNPIQRKGKRRPAARPLLKGSEPLERIRTLLAQREAAYATADATVDTEESIPEETAARVIAAWEQTVESWQA